MNQNEYVKLSLELHLFFDRIMKEHSLFLEAAFLEKDKELKKIANDFQKAFSNILERVINLANGNICRELISSNEIVTEHTLEAERKTSNLSGIFINTDITQKENNLKSGELPINAQLLNTISMINRQTIQSSKILLSLKMKF